MATDVKDGKVKVVMTALDESDEFYNNLAVDVSVVTSKLQEFEVNMKQVAPGRYVAEFPADQAGSYFLSISTGQLPDTDEPGPIIFLLV